MKVRIQQVQIFTITILLVFFTSGITYSQWTEVGSINGVGSYISAVSENIVYVFGGYDYNPRVYRSLNAGTNFTTLGANGLGLYRLYCGWGINADYCIAGNGGSIGGIGGNASFYKTTNGGALWSVVGSTYGSSGFFNGIEFSRINPSFGIAQSDPPLGSGNPFYIYVTNDGGTTWSLTTAPGVQGCASALNSVMVIDSLFYGFGLNAGASRIYMTSNGGTNWFIGNLGLYSNFVGGFVFCDDKLRGIASTGPALPSIARTTDGGLTWSTVNTNTPISGSYSICRWIPNTNVCYIASCASGGVVFIKSTDGGIMWDTMSTPVSDWIQHVGFYPSVTPDGITVYGFAITANGRILKVIDVISDIGNNNTIIPSEFYLFQNIPNPFNPSTKISFDIKQSSYTKLVVYDILGKEIVTLVNEKLAAGNYEVDWNASGFPSGVYFYKLETDNFNNTRKMVLLK